MIVLLSNEELKENSVVQENVDEKIINPTIKEVQIYYIKPILGTSLYKDILNKIETNSLTTDYKELIDDYILPCMIQWTLFELPYNMNYKFFNKSVGTQDADNMEAADLEELNKITDIRRNKAEYYSEQLTRFLMANPQKYPLYMSQTNVKCDTIFAKRSNYTSGLCLDLTLDQKINDRFYINRNWNGCDYENI
jgi:hypothetical protein